MCSFRGMQSRARGHIPALRAPVVPPSIVATIHTTHQTIHPKHPLPRPSCAAVGHHPMPPLDGSLTLARRPGWPHCARVSCCPTITLWWQRWPETLLKWGLEPAFVCGRIPGPSPPQLCPPESWAPAQAGSPRSPKRGAQEHPRDGEPPGLGVEDRFPGIQQLLGPMTAWLLPEATPPWSRPHRPGSRLGTDFTFAPCSACPSHLHPTQAGHISLPTVDPNLAPKISIMVLTSRRWKKGGREYVAWGQSGSFSEKA